MTIAAPGKLYFLTTDHASGISWDVFQTGFGGLEDPEINLGVVEPNELFVLLESKLMTSSMVLWLRILTKRGTVGWLIVAAKDQLTKFELIPPGGEEMP